MFESDKSKLLLSAGCTNFANKNFISNRNAIYINIQNNKFHEINKA